MVMAVCCRLFHGENLLPVPACGKSFTRFSINVYDKKSDYEEEGWNHS